MWEHIRNSTFRARRGTTGPHPHPHTAARSRRWPLVEVLETRELMTASLASIPDQSVPAQLGLQLALNGSASGVASQTFTATSDNPNIHVSVAQGPFWTVTVSHNSSGTGDPQINNQSMTFQLFQDLTPQTVARITNLTNLGYYTHGFPNANPPVPPGQFIPRITSTANAGFSVVQGGSSSPTSTASSSGIPPINTEPVQQLAFTGQSQLAMANTGQPTSTDAQFFITNGTQSASTQQSFDFNYTIFGQLVSGQQTLTNLSNVATTTPSGNPQGEKSIPVNPVVINAVTLSDNNPNGVLHIDTTGSQAGQTANITVTATDPATQTTATQTFKVTVSAYNGPTSPAINFIPITTPITTSTPPNTPLDVQLNAQNGYPGTNLFNAITYRLLSQPAHGTISNFDATDGFLVYTPNPGYAGPDFFQYEAIATPSDSTFSTTTSFPTMVSITTGVNTGAVRVIPSNPNGTSLPNSDVLVVTPPPGNHKVTDNIEVTQVADSRVAGGQRIVVKINGLGDLEQPAASSLLHIVIFGTKANDNIQVDPSVTVPTTLDSGHGGNNVVKGGGGPTREHGWFGHTLLVGGAGSNQLIGRKGVVRFQPSSTTTTIFAGVPHERGRRARAIRPGGTYYRYVHGRLVPVFSY